MDAELRSALRRLQDIGDFSLLYLDKILTTDGLEGLLRAAIIAKLKQENVNLVSASSFKKQKGDAPRLTIEKAHWDYPRHLLRWKYDKEPTSFLEVPTQLLYLCLGVNWTEKPEQINRPNTNFVNKVLVIEQSMADSTTWIAYAAYLWRETAESFEKTRIKKLKERGLIPGRRWAGS